MNPVDVVESTAVPLGRADIDTDQIVPSNLLQRTSRNGWEDALFANLRKDGDFVLNDQRYAGAQILIGGSNFGCGSSREHAVWALHDYGFKAVIASSFGDIFRANCIKNQLIPAQVNATDLGELLSLVLAEPAARIVISVAELTVATATSEYNFVLDSVSQRMLLTGADEIELSLASVSEVELYEFKRPRWLDINH